MYGLPKRDSFVYSLGYDDWIERFIRCVVCALLGVVDFDDGFNIALVWQICQSYLRLLFAWVWVSFLMASMVVLMDTLMELKLVITALSSYPHLICALFAQNNVTPTSRWWFWEMSVLWSGAWLSYMLCVLGSFVWNTGCWNDHGFHLVPLLVYARLGLLLLDWLHTWSLCSDRSSFCLVVVCLS